MRRCSSAEELKIAGTPPALACMLAHPAATWGAPFLPQTPRLTVSAPAAVALFRVQVIKVDVTKKVGHAADIHNAAGVGGVGGEQRQQHVGQQEVAEVVDLRLEGLLTVNSVEVERGLRSAVVVAFWCNPAVRGQSLPICLTKHKHAACALRTCRLRLTPNCSSNPSLVSRRGGAITPAERSSGPWSQQPANLSPSRHRATTCCCWPGCCVL